MKLPQLSLPPMRQPLLFDRLDTTYEFAKANFIPCHWWDDMLNLGYSELSLISHVTSFRQSLGLAR